MKEPFYDILALFCLMSLFTMFMRWIPREQILIVADLIYLSFWALTRIRKHFTSKDN